MEILNWDDPPQTIAKKSKVLFLIITLKKLSLHLMLAC